MGRRWLVVDKAHMMEAAPLLYHLLNQLLTKQERIYAYFTPIDWVNPISGIVKLVKLNNSGRAVVYVQDGQDVHFYPLDEEGADRLQLCRIGDKMWQLENVPVGAPEEPELESEQEDESSLEEAVNPEPPIVVLLVQNLLKKGVVVHFRFETSGHYNVVGDVQNIEYRIRNNIISDVVVELLDPETTFTERFGRDVFEMFDLQKIDGEWWLTGKN